MKRTVINKPYYAAGRQIGWVLTTTLSDGTVYRTFKGKLRTRKEEGTMVTRAVEPHEVPKDIRKAAMQGTTTPLVQLLEKAQEVLDVPDFMKQRSVDKKKEDRRKRIFKTIDGGKK